MREQSSGVLADQGIRKGESELTYTIKGTQANVSLKVILRIKEEDHQCSSQFILIKIKLFSYSSLPFSDRILLM